MKDTHGDDILQPQGGEVHLEEFDEEEDCDSDLPGKAVKTIYTTPDGEIRIMPVIPLSDEEAKTIIERINREQPPEPSDGSYSGDGKREGGAIGTAEPQDKGDGSGYRNRGSIGAKRASASSSSLPTTDELLEKLDCLDEGGVQHEAKNLASVDEFVRNAITKFRLNHEKYLGFWELRGRWFQRAVLGERPDYLDGQYFYDIRFVQRALDAEKRKKQKDYQRTVLLEDRLEQMRSHYENGGAVSKRDLRFLRQWGIDHEAVKQRTRKEVLSLIDFVRERCQKSRDSIVASVEELGIYLEKANVYRNIVEAGLTY